MTISYNWLSEYLPEQIAPEKLSSILTSLGLEVESLEQYEELKGGLQGLVIGEVLECSKHPNADKLSLTKVNTGSGEPLQIVCGAPNVAAGQKVVVAPVGATIYPLNSSPVTMKTAKIRGVESQGMICAEDEIGLSANHAGILVLPAGVQPGTPAAAYFKPYSDWVYEIGLTPNRMDAMSHLGVAKDVCAWLAHHHQKEYSVKTPYRDSFNTDNNSLPITVTIENINACQRYSGVSITGITIKESPQWLQQKLKAIGQRPINNVVDITNYVLHETGQPLHAFDASAIKGQKVIVKNLPDGSKFVTLDEKERKLHAEDLMICNGAGEGMCIAGVFGGEHSGVSGSTTNIFLESAWFNPVDIRKTSFRHGLRTDAAMHFEKNVDISNTVQVLKRAALLIKEIAGGAIASDIVDIYPAPKEKAQVQLSYNYLQKLSGKNYQPATVKTILTRLGFDTVAENTTAITVKAPFSKPDITLPADLVEEIMRVDGYDNIEIPGHIVISPSVDTEGYRHTYKEKVANYLTGLGFFETFTNSITNNAYYSEAELATAVKMLNSLTAELNIMRPSMLETGLQSVAHNLNRKNNDLLFFEFGKTYSTSGPGKYEEHEHLCLYITGNTGISSWKEKAAGSDLYYVKGVIQRALQLLGGQGISFAAARHPKLDIALQVNIQGQAVAILGSVHKGILQHFDCKQPVWYADINWEAVLDIVRKIDIKAAELPKQLPVQRDLALIVPKATPYETLETTVQKIRLDKLQSMQLFDVFESEKIGAGKKSLAVNFTFLDNEKTLTDKEIEAMMSKIMIAMEKEVGAEIRK